jgi:hypothetical protein
MRTALKGSAYHELKSRALRAQARVLFSIDPAATGFTQGH